MAAVTINQVAYGYADIKIEITALGTSFGILESGCQSISYNWSVERDDMYGGSRIPVDSTDGQAAFEASVTLNRHWVNYVIAQVAEMGIGLANLEMTIAVMYAKGDAPLTTDTLSRVRFIGFEHSHDQGPDVLEVECELHLMNIYYNGVDIFGNRL